MGQEKQRWLAAARGLGPHGPLFDAAASAMFQSTGDHLSYSRAPGALLYRNQIHHLVVKRRQGDGVTEATKRKGVLCVLCVCIRAPRRQLGRHCAPAEGSQRGARCAEGRDNADSSGWRRGAGG